MHRIAYSTSASVLLLAFISSATLLFRLGSLPLIGADEPRYARIAQEMSAAHRWVTPVLEGRPWLEKPPLYYWITIPLVRWLGPTETAARLGSTLMAFLAALALYGLGRMLWGGLAGLAGAAILLTNVGFAAFGRSASTDMPFTATLTVALSLLAARAAGRGSTGTAALGYVFLGLAVLAKGPVALLLAGAIVAVFWCFRPAWRLRQLHPLAGALIVAAVACPWFYLAFRENGFAFVAFFFINHNLARYVSELHHHSEPFYYYAPVLLGLVYPWTGWLAALIPAGGGWRRIRTLPERDPARFFLVVWTLVPLVFFSLSRSKLPGYILPVLPPLALLLGARLAELSGSESRNRRTSAAIAWAGLVTSAAVGVALPILLQRGYHTGSGGALLLGAVTFLPVVPASLFLLKSRWTAAGALVVAQSMMVIVTLTAVAYPGMAARHSTRDIAREALSARAPGEPIVSYKFFHHTLHYYTGYRVAEDLPDAAALDGLAERYPRILVVTEEIRLPELRSRQGCSATVIGRQGKLVLVRLERHGIGS